MKVIIGTNEGGLELVKNLLTSIKKVGINMSDVLLYNFKGDVAIQGVESGSLDFNRLMRAKVEVILDAMETNEKVLFIDSDVIFLQNCIEEVKHYCDSTDMCIQAHPSIEAPHCTGFWLVKTSQATKDYLHYIIEVMKQENDSEENVLNKTYRKSGLTISNFSKDHYPVGDLVWKSARHMSNLSDFKIIHNNYISGNQNKINRFKQFEMWNVDDSILESVEQKDWFTRLQPMQAGSH